jgi:SNF2 family DNA or RNA helicase
MFTLKETDARASPDLSQLTHAPQHDNNPVSASVSVAAYDHTNQPMSLTNSQVAVVYKGDDDLRGLSRERSQRSGPGDPFIRRKKRPEHHTDERVYAPRVAAYVDRPAAPLRSFRSDVDTVTKPIFCETPLSVSHTMPRAKEEDVYTDPHRASADLLALLEGGMDDDDDDDGEDDGRGEFEPSNHRGDSHVAYRSTKTQDPSSSNVSQDKHIIKVALDSNSRVPSPPLIDGTLTGLKVKLLPHQVDGVHWMKGRELGPVKRGKVPRGGILADDMGLGKTLQAISLILVNQKSTKETSSHTTRSPNIIHSTLIVAPLSLIRQWETEIEEKLDIAHRLRVCVYHGPNRSKRFTNLSDYDIVITTYQILVSEFGSTMEKEGITNTQTGCFAFHWWRVVLDEAHMIKNRNAKAAKACYALKSEFRWCLSGTPMQNNLDELQSLIKFLQIKPYDKLGEWKEHIEKPMKNGQTHIALRRLHSILRCFMKRRTKEILRQDGALNPGGKSSSGESTGTEFKVTERNIVNVEVEFSPAELHLYRRLKTRTDKCIVSMMKSKVNYANAFTLLLRLRQACDHPELLRKKIDADMYRDAVNIDTAQTIGTTVFSHKESSPFEQDAGEMDIVADLFADMDLVHRPCSVCGRLLSADSHDLCFDCNRNLDTFYRESENQRERQHDKLVDEDFTRNMSNDQVPKSRPRNQCFLEPHSRDKEDDRGDQLSANRSAKQFLTKIAKSESMKGASRSHDYTGIRRPDERDQVHQFEDTLTKVDGRPIQPSAKIRQVLKLVTGEMTQHKFIIFSEFTSMMDIMELFFDHENIDYTRYDGKMRGDEREASLERLRNDPACRVLLCSLKCGSLGLNLTAATRVIILEPFWNPFVEEQAIDRVHRLTQTVDVVVYKVTVKDTVEQRILELQDNKRTLAKQAIEGGARGAMNRLGLEELLNLFRPDRLPSGTPLGPTLRGPHGLINDPSDNGRKHTSVKERKSHAQEDNVYGRRW